jgi:hypothetical protein
MPNEPESRLRELFAQLPTATKAVEERALAAALAALPPAGARHRRPFRTAFLVAAGTVLLLAVSAGALAAAGALHVSLGGSERSARQRAPIVPRLIVPRGARGIVAVVDGRLWFTSRSGLRIEGLPVESAALSPHALYVAAGIGDSLVVMAPDGTRAWSHRAGGRVVGIAWAPSGLRIAYVVQRTSGGVQLRTIEGDGDHDRVLDAAVRPVAPSWRADALAVAYVGAGGHPVVYDFARRAHHVVEGGGLGETLRVSFAPHGRALAIGSAGRIWVSGVGPVPRRGGDFSPDSIAGVAWAGDQIAVALNAPSKRAAVQLVGLAKNGATIRGKRLLVSGEITALDARGGRVVLALRRPGLQTRLVASTAPDRPARSVLLDVGAGSTVDELAVR